MNFMSQNIEGARYGSGPPPPLLSFRNTVLSFFTGARSLRSTGNNSSHMELKRATRIRSVEPVRTSNRYYCSLLSSFLVTVLVTVPGQIWSSMVVTESE